MKQNGRVFQNKLRRFRRLFGFTQKEAAQRLGLSCRSILSHWERGERMPGGEDLIKLCVLYQTLPGELYPELTKEAQKSLSEWQKAHFEDEF